MIDRTLRRARWLWTTIRLVDNWPSVYRRKLLGKKEPQLIKLRNQCVFEAAATDTDALPIIAEVFGKKVYEEGLRIASPNPVVIDIGGNVGASTVFFLKNMPSARVYVFEPEPVAYAMLTKNVAMNGVSDRVTAVNRAVAGKIEKRDLFVTINSGTSSLAVSSQRVGRSIQVDCTTLERVFSEYGLDRCDLLKIDCEGAEYEILLQTPREILSAISTIILEWHSVPGHSPQELERYLGAAGYATRRRSTGRILVAQRPVSSSQR